MRLATKSNSKKYYEYILTHVDDLRVISLEPKSIVAALQEVYWLKDIVKSTMYLKMTAGHMTLKMILRARTC